MDGGLPLWIYMRREKCNFRAMLLFAWKESLGKVFVGVNYFFAFSSPCHNFLYASSEGRVCELSQ